MLELKKLSSSSASYKLCGGFHLHPTLIEQALQDCCSDWEAKSAGAPPAESWQERRMQIAMDVPKMNLKVDSTSFGPATEGAREQNIAEKEVCCVCVVCVCVDGCMRAGCHSPSQPALC